MPRVSLRFADAGSEPAPDEGDYEVSSEANQQLILGTVDIGNHCDDCATTIALPFPVAAGD